LDALSILGFGHRDVMRVFDGLSEADWNRVGVTSRWSPKDLLSHLTSFELMLEEALRGVAGETGPTPTLEAMGKGGKSFNEDQVKMRRGRPAAEVMAEYEKAHESVIALAKKLGPDKLREVGTIPWYGANYALDDLIVYTNYAHKREHCAQMRRWRTG